MVGSDSPARGIRRHLAIARAGTALGTVDPVWAIANRLVAGAALRLDRLWRGGGAWDACGFAGAIRGQRAPWDIAASLSHSAHHQACDTDPRGARSSSVHVMTALDDIRLKIGRAEQHLDALSKDIRQVVAAHQTYLTSQQNPVDGSHTAVLHNVPPVSREWVFVLGIVFTTLAAHSIIWWQR